MTGDDDVRWLSCLVWPGESDRQARLAAAVASARRDPPAVHRGDLRTDLPAVAAQAPTGATLVIYHSAVLAYVAPTDGREQFAATSGAWAPCGCPTRPPACAWPVACTDFREGTLVLGHDGQAPLALADGHGAWLRWLGGPGA